MKAVVPARRKSVSRRTLFPAQLRMMRMTWSNSAAAWFRECSLRRVCGEFSSCHYCLLMNVIYSYRYKTKCCCFACSNIDLGRLEVLNEQSIVSKVVTSGIQ